MSFVIIDD